MIIAGEVLARSGEGWKSGPIGLATILVLCVAVYFLFKSMSKHLKKVRDEFPTELPGSGRSGGSAATSRPVEPAPGIASPVDAQPELAQDTDHPSAPA